MKIVVAADSFKDCLSAQAVCEAISSGVREANPEAELVCVPLADGGEGTAKVLMQAMGGERLVKLVNGPMPGKRLKAGFIWCAQDQTAIVEMAEASGLQRIPLKARTPMETTSLGTGQLILAAVQKGAQRILLTVGGSATVDLGIGMASALGWQFLDHRGEAVAPVGKHLLRIQKIVPPETPWHVPVDVLCDVTNPVLGFHGAAHVFAPQKGASLSDVVLLEVGLTQVVSVIKDQFGLDIQGISSGGGRRRAGSRGQGIHECESIAGDRSGPGTDAFQGRPIRCGLGGHGRRLFGPAIPEWQGHLRRGTGLPGQTHTGGGDCRAGSS